ncbi:MAG: DUF4142 domain-containing protein [Vicinamibacteraceae bacterium]
MTRVPFIVSVLLVSVLVGVTFGAGAPLPAQALADPARTPDAAFVAKASEAAAADLQLAKLAVTRAAAAGIKALARTVVDSRTVLARDLATMAGTRQIASPPHPDAKPASALRAQPRASFDAAFLAAMITNGEAAVALFDTESRDGRDDEIKEWAARQLPALREHLTAVRALRLRAGS